MPRSRYRFGNPDTPHFLTCTVNRWTPLFTRPETVEIVFESFRYLQREEGLKLYGYVVLENHLHWIAQSEHLEAAVRRFKSYTARRIIDHLESLNAGTLLEHLAHGKRAYKNDRDYQVWEEGSHPQEINGVEMLRQKLDYIHLNPVKRGYVAEPEHWRYSSAGNYVGKGGLMDVYMNW